MSRPRIQTRSADRLRLQRGLYLGAPFKIRGLVQSEAICPYRQAPAVGRRCDLCCAARRTIEGLRVVTPNGSPSQSSLCLTDFQHPSVSETSGFCISHTHTQTQTDTTTVGCRALTRKASIPSPDLPSGTPLELAKNSAQRHRLKLETPRPIYQAPTPSRAMYERHTADSAGRAAPHGQCGAALAALSFSSSLHAHGARNRHTSSQFACRFP